MNDADGALVSRIIVALLVGSVGHKTNAMVANLQVFMSFSSRGDLKQALQVI